MPNVNMTYNQAMKIQADQFEYYSRQLTPEAKKRFAEMLAADTKPCPFDPDKPTNICGGMYTPGEVTINELVPRGTWFEGEKQMAFRLDPNNLIDGPLKNWVLDVVMPTRNQATA